MSDRNAHCHFCAKWANEVKAFVEGPAGAGICDECSELIAETMAEKLPRALQSAPRAVPGREPTPEQVKALVKLVIMGIQFADVGHYVERDGERMYHTTTEQIDNLSEVGIELARKIIAAGWRIYAAPEAPLPGQSKETLETNSSAGPQLSGSYHPTSPSRAGQQGEAMEEAAVWCDEEAAKARATSGRWGAMIQHNADARDWCRHYGAMDEAFCTAAAHLRALRASAQPTPPMRGDLMELERRLVKRIDQVLNSHGARSDPVAVRVLDAVIAERWFPSDAPAPAAMAEALRDAAENALGSLRGVQGIMALHKLDNSVSADVSNAITRLEAALAQPRTNEAVAALELISEGIYEYRADIVVAPIDSPLAKLLVGISTIVNNALSHPSAMAEAKGEVTE